jgi:hypothetical protein
MQSIMSRTVHAINHETIYIGYVCQHCFAGLNACNDAPCLIRHSIFVALTARSLPDRKAAICAGVKTSCVLKVLSFWTSVAEYMFATVRPCPWPRQYMNRPFHWMYHPHSHYLQHCGW